MKQLFLVEECWAVVVKKTGKILSHNRNPLNHVHKYKVMADCDLKLQKEPEKYVVVRAGIAPLYSR